uniref:Alternative protein ZBTB33 n=1 Tax=Homo sapiens TaxID=9606 RepID=L8E7W8_HUMAN|nr:alternative protein ZBTB33 [Homo sapiens]
MMMMMMSFFAPRFCPQRRLCRVITQWHRSNLTQALLLFQMLHLVLAITRPL